MKTPCGDSLILSPWTVLIKHKGVKMNYRIEEPNYTQIPNIIFDHWMKELSPACFKVLCVICRKTFGWHKGKDKISIKQLMEHSGLSRQGVVTSVDLLIELGLIFKETCKDSKGGSGVNFYGVSVNCLTKGEAENVTPPSLVSRPTKESSNKEREHKYTENAKKSTLSSFGENGLVKMTEEDFQKLCDSFGRPVILNKIQDVDDYFAIIGPENVRKKYISHPHVIRGWLRREGIRPTATVINQDETQEIIKKFKSRLFIIDPSSMITEKDGSFYIESQGQSHSVPINPALKSNLNVVLAILGGQK